MENSKETDINGISETMLQTLYARAKESEKPKNSGDALNVEITDYHQRGGSDDG